MAAAFIAIAAIPGVATAGDGILGTDLSGSCNGVADTSCTYCSYEGGNAGQPFSRCANGMSGYYWLSCYTWASNTCIIG